MKAHTLMIAAFAVSFPIMPASADEVPRRTSLDQRVREVNYNERQVYSVTGVFRSATQIVFSDREVVEHVALGDTVSWEVAPAGNTLFVKPREFSEKTNLIVITRSPYGPRTYTFELTSRKGAITGGDTFFRVLFRYPEQEAAEAARREALAAAARLREVEQAAIAEALDIGVLQGERNVRYTVQGDPALQPSEVSDNGQFTVMRFPAQQPVPAIFGVTSDGTETLVQFDVRDTYVVVHGVYAQLRLRQGESVLCIYNEAPDFYGRDPATNTASDLIEREGK